MEKYSIFRETGKQIGSARLTGRAEIVQMLNQGKSIAAICKEYGIARNTFDRFRRQYTYTIIKGEKTLEGKRKCCGVKRENTCNAIN